MEKKRENLFLSFIHSLVFGWIAVHIFLVHALITNTCSPGCPVSVWEREGFSCFLLTSTVVVLFGALDFTFHRCSLSLRILVCFIVLSFILSFFLSLLQSTILSVALCQCFTFAWSIYFTDNCYSLASKWRFCFSFFSSPSNSHVMSTATVFFPLNLSVTRCSRYLTVTVPLELLLVHEIQVKWRSVLHSITFSFSLRPCALA